MRSIIAIILLAVISAPSVARSALDDVSVSLPLEGYYRPGQLMPVRLLAPNVPLQHVIVLSADGAIRTQIDPPGTSVDGIFPWLVYSDQPRNPAVAIYTESKPLQLTFKPLAADERLVGIAAAQMPDDAWLQALFPGKRVISIRIATADLTRGPVAAWGALDALVLDAATLPRGSPMDVRAPELTLNDVTAPGASAVVAGSSTVDPWDQRINKWLMEGIAVVVRGGEPPERTPIWKPLTASEGDWIARVNVAGPRGYFSADAYAPVAGWRPGRSVDFRWQLFLRAICFAIIALSVALWKPRFALFTMVGVVAVFVIAIAFWESRSSTTVRRTGRIVVRHGKQAGQLDRWTWTSAIKPASLGSFKPIFNSPEQALRTNALLLCVAEPTGYVTFKYDLRAGDVVAECSRQLMPLVEPMPTRPATSPLAELARRGYLDASGSKIDGELTRPMNEPEVEPDAWNDAVRKLLLAANDFIVKRRNPDGRDGTSIIAGYPWFADWGRDTFISLPGLLLTTRRFAQARQVLTVFGKYVSEGMIPNRFDDYTNQPHYNTVDASLWYIHAAFEYFRLSNDAATFEGELLPACKQIIAGYKRGTRFGIRMDERDGLITQGDPHTQLTWMDAKHGDVAFTPREGKPVEINALWYHALVLLGEHDLAARVAASFTRVFWINPFRGLADVVRMDGEQDKALRPNQIFAVSLPNSPLNREQQQAVVEVVRRELLTPYGLRTLSRDDPNYHARYLGPPEERDNVYHNGIVWPWLIGGFLEAYLKVNDRSPDAVDQLRQWLQPLIDFLDGGMCVGQLPEIFEAESPQEPVGCCAQAWSVAEVLRMAVEVEM
jgi:hypothetical protein